MNKVTFMKCLKYCFPVPKLFRCLSFCLDSTAVSIFVVILVELTNTVFVNSTNITTNIETAALSHSAFGEKPFHMECWK